MVIDQTISHPGGCNVEATLMSLERFKRALGRLQIEQASALSSLVDEETRLDSAKTNLANCEEALELIQGVAKVVQEQAHDKLASVVTRCLQSVFGEDSPEFKIIFERKRNKTEARLVFIKDGHEINPVDSSGGGSIDVASFALRVACLMLSKPALRRVLFLDEPFKHLSKQYRPAVRELLETLSRETKIQIIMVTHDEEFQIGEVLELE